MIPACAAAIHVFVNDLRCRPRLARLAAAVAARVNGWVELDGDLADPPNAEPIPSLVAELNRCGRCFRINSFCYLDSAALEAWLEHPPVPPHQIAR
jgi:hypothetical protein